jgi:hypothetical protein
MVVWPGPRFFHLVGEASAMKPLDPGYIRLKDDAAPLEDTVEAAGFRMKTSVSEDGLCVVATLVIHEEDVAEIGRIAIKFIDRKGGPVHMAWLATMGSAMGHVLHRIYGLDVVGILSLGPLPDAP